MRVLTSMGTLMHWFRDPGDALLHLAWVPGTHLGKRPVWYYPAVVS